MQTAIPTIEGPQIPTAEDVRYMEYLTELWASDYDFGLLLFKGDPVAFRIGRDEWILALDSPVAHTDDDSAE